MLDQPAPKRIPMQDAARLWSRITGVPRPHRATLIRWATRGVKGTRLRAERLGGRWWTTPDDVRDFHRLMGAGPDDAIMPTPASRSAEIQKHLNDLDSRIAPRPSGRRKAK
jgi:hypothetical protein